MATLYTHQSANIWKTWGFMGLFFALVILLGYVLAVLNGRPEVLYLAVTLALILNITSYWYSDKIVLKLHKAKPVTREEYFDLWNVTENLSITAGLPMPKLFVVEDASPNAFATGRDKTHAVVCVTSGLLNILNKQELEGVIAHELSHIGNRDMLLSTVVVVLVGFVSLLSDMFLRSHLFRSRGRDESGSGVVILFGVLLAILAPLSATLIQLAISRKREFLADASGALLTRYPEGLASALKKISTQSLPLKTASNATAHLFIANPFGKGGKRLTNLFMTHPPVEERITALLGPKRAESF